MNDLDPYNRDDFITILSSLFDWRTFCEGDELENALLTQDVLAVAQITSIKTQCESRKDYYINAYDGAQNDQEKAQVIASVQRKLV